MTGREKHPSFLKQELLAEEAELGEENRAWKRLPAKERIAALSHIARRLSYVNPVLVLQSPRLTAIMGISPRIATISPPAQGHMKPLSQSHRSGQKSTRLLDNLSDVQSMSSHYHHYQEGDYNKPKSWQSPVPVLSRPEKLFAQIQAGRQQREQQAGSGSPVKRNAPSEDQFLSSQQNNIGSKPVTSLQSDIDFHQHGAEGLAWTYRTHTSADEIIEKAGVLQWSKPQTYFQPVRLKKVRASEYLTEAPVCVRPTSYERRAEPLITFDGSAVSITPHFPPWQDARSDVSHPDYLPTSKLSEYQACEVAGYSVYRHGRDSFRCNKANCQEFTPDFSPETRICIGCGPRSFIRYCSHKHEVEDFKSHWGACGSDQLVARCIIDHSTAPQYFHSLCPAIKMMDGVRSVELHRQRYFSCHSRGHYTLFDLKANASTTLVWPKSDPQWREMDSRIERLLNIALLDTKNYDMLRYLYGLLRRLISITPLNSKNTLQALKSQFGAEFGKETLHKADSEPIFPCECTWIGKGIPPHAHLKNCRTNLKGEALLKQATELEGRYWILRAWAQQHPTVSCWKRRAHGDGFVGVCTGKAIELGPGFVGWGAEPTNMCD